MYRFALAAVWMVSLFAISLAQKWCNKNYMSNETVVPPGGQFVVPETSSTPLMAFRCAPVIRPYIADDSGSLAGILIDAPITYTKISGAVPITLPSTLSNRDVLAVTVSVNGKTLAQGNVPLNTTKHELPFSLLGLQTQQAAYNISCSATYSLSTDGQSSSAVRAFKSSYLPSWAELFQSLKSIGPIYTRAVRDANLQIFEATAALYYLPNPTQGSTTKMDLRTGALLAKPANGSEGNYDTIFPIGFYTAYGGYLASNLSKLDEIKEQGFTIVHPIPPFGSQEAVREMLDHIQEVGLYLMYDMRGDYMDSNAVTQQVNMIKSRPNLLLWYTSDEPDGTSDPLNATTIARDLIYSLDGYHPVSLVLNCQDYEFTSYASGADILLQDPYMIGNNVTYSTLWNTSCTTDFGCCGCDNCKGQFEDISERIDSFKERMLSLGWERTKAIWSVPQAFGNSEYWSRTPTGMEWVVQAILAINHGAVGIIPWDDPTTSDIKSSASAFAQSLPQIKTFLFNPRANVSHFTSNRVDVGLWTVDSQTLVLATNLNYYATTFDLGDLLTLGTLNQVFNGGSVVNGSGITFQSVGSGAFVFA